MTQTKENTIAQSTGSIKAIKIITIIRLLIVFAFYVVFTVKDIKVGDVGPEIILYTAIAFSVMLVAIFISINRRQIVLLRIFLVADMLIAIPASAYISIVLSLVSIGLTFTRSSRNYFESQK